MFEKDTLLTAQGKLMCYSSTMKGTVYNKQHSLKKGPQLPGKGLIL